VGVRLMGNGLKIVNHANSTTTIYVLIHHNSQKSVTSFKRNKWQGIHNPFSSAHQAHLTHKKTFFFCPRYRVRNHCKSNFVRQLYLFLHNIFPCDITSVHLSDIISKHISELFCKITQKYLIYSQIQPPDTISMLNMHKNCTEKFVQLYAVYMQFYKGVFQYCISTVHSCTDIYCSVLLYHSQHSSLGISSKQTWWVEFF
jgi:hypothetical protein